MKISTKMFNNWPIGTINIDDSNYPQALKKIRNPPPKLYFRGNYSQGLFKRCVAVVGSRKNTKYGQSVVSDIVPKLVAKKITIISGFMYGIDSLAHLSCLEYGGKTIAVLGNGLNVIYPDRHKKLYLDILEKDGLLISEYEASFKPTLWSFPQRNRIVAGLANMGIIVIEAGEKSGSLITARIGIEEKRKVYCVPGPINSSVSMGCNYLIKTGKAKLITCADDVLGQSNAKTNNQLNLFDSLDKDELLIYKLLLREPLSADEIGKAINLNISTVCSILTILEMKGVIEESMGKYYVS